MLTPLWKLREMYQNDWHKVMQHNKREKEIWSYNRSRYIPSIVHYNMFLNSGNVLRDAYATPCFFKYYLKPGFFFEEFVH